MSSILTLDTKFMKEKTCPNCNKSHKGKRIKCSVCYQRDRRNGLKAKAVAYKGGACERCGYNKCMKALHFHHLDPSEKDFHITGSEYHSWEKVVKELNKCLLLCANCHYEEHEKINEGD